MKFAVDHLKSDYANELFLYFYRDYRLRNHTLFNLFWKKIFFILFVGVICILSFLLSLFVCLFPRKCVVIPTKVDGLCILRSFAASSKLSFLEGENVLFFYDSPFTYNVKNNIYGLSFRNRLRALLHSIKITCKDVFELYDDIYPNTLDLLKVCKFYLLRVPQKICFESYLHVLFPILTPSLLITGNKEDRFALVEQKISRSYNTKLVCYPHGLEYGVRLPRGVVGDEFFCYSEYTCNYYKELYSESKQAFIYSPVIVKSLLSKESAVDRPVDRVVFFPESRGLKINLYIVGLLLSEGVDLFVKLHPLDNKQPYILKGISESNFISFFEEAITSKIIIARKSTVLLESVYNNRIACALLFDEADRKSFYNDFPSLREPKIFKFHSSDDFFYWLSNTSL